MMNVVLYLLTRRFDAALVGMLMRSVLIFVAHNEPMPGFQYKNIDAWIMQWQWEWQTIDIDYDSRYAQWICN